MSRMGFDEHRLDHGITLDNGLTSLWVKKYNDPALGAWAQLHRPLTARRNTGR